ncbi:hypothetical protein ACFL6C_05730 [Myxococcota bacterium]
MKGQATQLQVLVFDGCPHAEAAILDEDQLEMFRQIREEEDIKPGG